MAIANLVLEFVRVLLSWPVIVLTLGLVFFFRFHDPIRALIGRIASIKFAGSEVLLPQVTQNTFVAVEGVAAAGSSAVGALDVAGPAAAPNPNEANPEQQLRSANERALLWEYRFLNYFLVPRTQSVLDWLAARQPTAYATYDSWMSHHVPNPLEREAMINALRNHHLIEIIDGMISVNPKGHDYLLWRGPIQRLLTAMFGSRPVPPPAPVLPDLPHPNANRDG